MSQSATSKSIKITGHEIRLLVDRQWIANGSLDLVGSPLDRLDRILVLTHERDFLICRITERFEL